MKKLPSLNHPEEEGAFQSYYDSGPLHDIPTLINSILSPVDREIYRVQAFEILVDGKPLTNEIRTRILVPFPFSKYSFLPDDMSLTALLYYFHS